ncbi:PhnB protein [Paucimonas lemoignei]|uniref:PhnB protein n=1 Tax=Paucimonas lemoignei TaxID=29443 RepID=A0A4R3HV21_PAULE|nr:VOC family protein [Paucimonas lemoignei]TCS36353.1 PhnB protein [Paucimonas lemoignei]
MPQPIAYLNFNGNCAEAMRFYERVLNGKLEKLIHAKDSPWADQMPADQGDMVMHACLALDGNGLLYGGDCPGQMPYEGIKGVSLTLNYDTVEEAQRVFDSLAAGGTIAMAMQPSFWAKTWGMLVDRFGTPWIVNGEMLPY